MIRTTADPGDAPIAAHRRHGLPYRLGRLTSRCLRPRRWSVRRLVVVGLLLLAASFTLLLVRGWSLASQTPQWWHAAGELDESLVPLRAEGVERGVTAALYSHRPGNEPWTVELRGEDANAWLRERLPRWLANRGERWPEHISPPRIKLDAGKITLGVAVRSGITGTQRIVGITFRPQLDQQGRLSASDARAHIGRTSLPGAGGAGGKWTSWLPEEWTKGEKADWILSALAGSQPLLEDSSIALDDGRTVRLIGLAVEEGRLRLTCVSRNGNDGAAE